MTINEALTILEVAASATPEEIQRAYRGLTRVWHPDRFPNDPELQRKAQEKLKQINAAYEALRSAAFAAGQAATPPPTAKPSASPKSAPVPSQELSSTSPKSAKHGRWRVPAFFAVLLILCGLVVRFINDISQSQWARQDELRESLKIADSRPSSPAKQYTSPSSGMKFTLVTAGEFVMGSPPSDELRSEAEGPQHPVRITKPFYIGTYEVTQGEFQKVLGRNPSEFSATGSRSEGVRGVNTSRFPVENVTWFDATEFCNRLSEADRREPYYRLTVKKRSEDDAIADATVTVMDSNGYRLPTEAEWEYACRAGTTTPFHFGSTLCGDNANVDGYNLPYPIGTTVGVRLGRTTAVDEARYPRNAFGLAQLHGNVGEWCEDVFDEHAYAVRSGVTTNPIVTSGSEHRVCRGGWWIGPAAYSRSASRGRGVTGDGGGKNFGRGSHLGFRVVCWLSP